MARFSPLLGHPFAAAVAGAAGGPGGLSPGAPGATPNGVPGAPHGLNPTHLPHLKSDPYGNDHPLAGHPHMPNHHQRAGSHHEKDSPNKYSKCMHNLVEQQ